MAEELDIPTDQLQSFYKGLQAIILKYGKWGTDEFILKRIKSKSKTLFSKTFGPRVKDKYRPRIDYTVSTMQMQFSFEEKEK